MFTSLFKFFKERNSEDFCGEMTNVKIVLLGDDFVGKSSLIQRFLTGRFPYSIFATIGVDRHVKEIFLEGKGISLIIWDTAGHERFWDMIKSVFKMIGADGVLLVYDVTRPETFRTLSKMLCEVRNINENIEILIAGNKNEDPSKKALADSELKSFARREKLEHMEMSVMTGKNVEKTFHHLVRKVLVAKGILAEKITKHLAPDDSSSVYETCSGTIGVDMQVKKLLLKGKEITLSICDTPELLVRDISVFRSYYKMADGVLLVHDVTNPESFQKLSKMLYFLRHVNENAEILIAGNKNEDPSKKAVAISELEMSARNGKLEFMELSGKSEGNVEETFLHLANKILIAKGIFTEEPAKNQAPEEHNLPPISKTCSGTVGVDMQVKKLFLEGKEITLSIWDTPGQLRDISALRSYYKMVDGVILDYDITNPESFRKLSKILCDLRDVNENAEILVAGSTNGDPSKKTVAVSKLKSFARNGKLEYMELSRKSERNIEETFHRLASRVLIAKGILTEKPAEILAQDKHNNSFSSDYADADKL